MKAINLSTRTAIQAIKRRRFISHRQRSAISRWGRLGLGCSVFLGITFSLLVLSAAVFYSNLTTNLPSIAALPALLDSIDGQLLQPTRLYDRTGQHLLLTLENPGIDRRYLPLDPALPDHFSPQLIQATQSILQPDFWRSPGFSFSHMLNPAPKTITERLVDSVLLSGEPSGYRRALRMRLLSAQVVARYGRARVLEWYLNSAYYGHLAYGADSAARLYLGKPASALNLAEAVLLVTASEAPALNPLDAPVAAVERQQQALRALWDRRIISDDAYLEAIKIQIPIHNVTQPPEEFARAFNRAVLEELEARYGRQRLERGGLIVVTTLDYPLQEQVNCVLATQLQRLHAGEDGHQAIESSCDAARLLPTLPPLAGFSPDDVAGSAVLIDVTSGQIRALVGETDGSEEKTVIPRRPPGSLLSPFVALTAFARSYGPASLVWDVPGRLPETLAGSENPDGAFHGPRRLRLALANDYLIPVTQLLLQLGASSVWRQAETLGLSGLQSENPEKLLFEGGSVSPLDIAAAYSLFANKGVRVGRVAPGESTPSLTPIVSVEDRAGRLLLGDSSPDTQSVISPQLAYLVNHILSDESARWPSLGYPNPLEIGTPAGAKMGRVKGDKDLWAVGYSPKMLGVVWLGLKKDSSENEKLDPAMASGIWHALMQYAVKSQSGLGWDRPDGVVEMEVCDPSGKLLTADCPQPVREVFLAGNEPIEYDNLYRVVQINRETGRLATVFTPLELVAEKTFLVVPPDAEAWARTSGLAMPPTDYDAIQAPPPLPNVRVDKPTLFSFIHGKISVQGTAGGEGFSSYRLQVGQGLNPRDWLQLGEESQQPVSAGELATWDTATGPDGLYGLRLIVLRSDQRLESAVVQVTVDNTPPTAQIPYPQAGQEYALRDNPAMTFQADAEDAIGLERIVWILDGQEIDETRQTPYVVSWKAQKGQHSLQVKAFDMAGNEALSDPVSFTVR